MLYRFEPDKRYLSLFPAVAVAGVALTVIGGLLFGYNGTPWGFPIIMVWLTASQLWSGVALDGRWVARHKKGSLAFSGTIAWGFVLPGAFASYVVWGMVTGGM